MSESMNEDTELMSLADLDQWQLILLRDGIDDDTRTVHHHRFKDIVDQARAAHKLKQRVEELERFSIQMVNWSYLAANAPKDLCDKYDEISEEPFL